VGEKGRLKKEEGAGFPARPAHARKGKSKEWLGGEETETHRRQAYVQKGKERVLGLQGIEQEMGKNSETMSKRSAKS